MNLTKWFGMLVVMLALTGFVVAETNDSDMNTTQSQALNVRYDHLQCKVEFTNTQIDILSKYVPTVNQTENKEQLLVDMKELYIFVNSNDKEGFDNYVAETLRSDLNNASKDLTLAKNNFKQYNLSNTTRTAIISELKDAKETYSECISDKEIKMSKVMEKHMENWNEQLEKIIEKMDKKNITTTNMTAIIAEIRERNEKLQELIDSGNITEIREFMKAYHDSQFNYAARFEVARLNGYKEKLEPLADKYKMSEYMNKLGEKIHAAEKYAKEGNKSYDNESDTKYQKMWDDIRGAGKDMKEIAKNINDERSRERQENMNERQEEMQKRQQERMNRTNGSERYDQQEDD